MTYREQLLSPFWQRKRLEALSAADFSCQHCYDKEETLHVHHKLYVKGRKAWEYELSELLVLCESCHEEEHERTDRISRLLPLLDPMGGPLNAKAFMAAGVAAMYPVVGSQGHELCEYFLEACPESYFASSIGFVLIEELDDMKRRGEIAHYGRIVVDRVLKRFIDDVEFRRRVLSEALRAPTISSTADA